MQVGDLVTWKEFIGVITCIVYEDTNEVEVHWNDGEVTPHEHTIWRQYASRRRGNIQKAPLRGSNESP